MHTRLPAYMQTLHLTVPPLLLCSSHSWPLNLFFQHAKLIPESRTGPYSPLCLQSVHLNLHITDSFYKLKAWLKNCFFAKATWATLLSSSTSHLPSVPVILSSFLFLLLVHNTIWNYLFSIYVYLFTFWFSPLWCKFHEGTIYFLATTIDPSTLPGNVIRYLINICWSNTLYHVLPSSTCWLFHSLSAQLSYNFPKLRTMLHISSASLLLISKMQADLPSMT